MAFLDNSGDIILDAVLTDAGRQRMARGNFKITKFALGDEEVNYALFNGSHTSGSAFYDLEVMQTPILEAFTNNTSLMKSKLVTISRNNILYMPVLRVNEHEANGTQTAPTSNFSNGFIILADTNTETATGNDRLDIYQRGILRGEDANITGDKTTHIAIDQGIDTSAGGQSFKSLLPDDLLETAFLIRVDHRLLQIHQLQGAPSPNTDPKRTVSLINQFVDDDGIASYYVSIGDGTSCVEGKPGSGAMIRDGRGGPEESRAGLIGSTKTLAKSTIYESFDGPLGSILRIYPRTSNHIRQSSALFDELGTAVSSGTNDIDLKGNSVAAETVTDYKYIDTLINVVGVTTGYSLDVPVRIVRKA